MGAIRLPAFEFTPHRIQGEFIRSRKRFVAASAANRSGKTVAASIHLLQRCYELLAAGHVNPTDGGRPAIHAIVVAPTYGMLDPPLTAIREVAGKDLIEGFNKHAGKLCLRGNVVIQFASGEDGGERLRGIRAHAAWLEEITTPGVEPRLWLEVLRARLADWAPHSFALFTGVPEQPGHWFHREVIQRAIDGDPLYAEYTWPASANPALSIDEILAAKDTLPDRVFKRLWLGEWNLPSDARVFEEFSDAHILTLNEAYMRFGRSLPVAARRAVIGHDPGFSSAGAAVALLDMGDAFLVADEHYASRVLPFGDPGEDDNWATILVDMKNQWNADTVIVDSERPDVITSLNRRGINARGAIKDVLPGLLTVATWLHPGRQGPRLYFLDRCKETIADVRNASWAHDKRTGQYRDDEIDMKVRRHNLDALRYAMMEATRGKPTGWERQGVVRRGVFGR